MTTDPTKGAFVAISGMDGTGCGTQSAPCRSVTAGMAAAIAAKKAIVYVAEGTYLETVNLDALTASGLSTFTIAGGWADQSGVWAPVCGDPSFIAAQTTIQAISGSAFPGLVIVSSLTLDYVMVSAPTMILLQNVSLYSMGDGGGGG
jgi:hypothetical protein